MNIQNLGLLFIVGAVAGFINVNAGGGSSLTLPTLIFLGLDGALANGTNRVALVIQNIFAIASFKKRKVHSFGLSSRLSLLTLPGAIIGAMLATGVDNLLFQRILGVVLVFIVLSMFFARSYTNREVGPDHKPSWLLYPALVGIGFYGGFLQIGVGFLFMACLYHLLEPNLVRVNMHKVFIVLIYMVPTIIVFALSSKINWTYGLALGAGNAIGAWWGAHASVKGGEKLIRIVLAIAIFIMALKLFGLF